MKKVDHTTLDEQASEVLPAGEAFPGLVAIFSCTRPIFVPISLARGAVEIGRTTHDGLLDDERLSRKHVRIEHARGKFVVTDLGSRNGTFVDGVRLSGSASFEAPRVLRIGRTVLLFVQDLLELARGTVTSEGGVIVGPRLALALRRVGRAATLGTSLLVTGESGVGKELAARHFHTTSPRSSGPFVAVNCATIQPSVAERLLFGARKGAYSGANTDAEGYAQAASGGTLFLDEVGELEPTVQAKLLRLLEAGEILPVGASRPQRADLYIVAATLRNLRADAARGKFREDLYYRLGQPEVQLPPLRERFEELPWIAQLALQRAREDLVAHPALIEACVLRAWPGNVRELHHELRQAAQNALARGQTLVEALDLDPAAGQLLVDDPEPTTSSSPKPSDEQIVEALRRELGNVSAAARVLGMHRTQLRRWLEKRRADPRSFASCSASDDEPADLG